MILIHYSPCYLPDGEYYLQLGLTEQDAKFRSNDFKNIPYNYPEPTIIKTEKIDGVIVLEVMQSDYSHDRNSLFNDSKKMNRAMTKKILHPKMALWTVSALKTHLLDGGEAIIEGENSKPVWVKSVKEFEENACIR